MKYSQYAELMAYSLTAQKDICTGIEIFAQSQVLVDGFYPAPSCFQRCSERYRFTIEKNLAAVGFIDTGDHFDERGLSSTIVSEESYYFTGVNVQADMIDCDQATEVFIEIFDL